MVLRKTKKIKSQKKTFEAIRRNLLNQLAKGQKNINELARDSKINWKTAYNHMIYLRGKRYVKFVINLPQVKIFELTQSGLEASINKKNKI